MPGRRTRAARTRAARVIVALAAALACLGAVAYAGGRPEGKGSSGAKLPRPQLSTRTEAVSTRAAVRFKFAAPGEDLRFQCRLDQGAWKACQSPRKVRGIGAGQHAFSVRAVRRSLRGPAARFSWTKVDPRQLTVEPSPLSLAPLRPGDPAQPIPVRIVNPNAVAVTVTSLTVAVSADPPGCPANPNLELGASSLSPTTPVVLPAGGELTLPSGPISAPTIALRELPFNQDACQGASFPLRFDAEGRG